MPAPVVQQGPWSKLPKEIQRQTFEALLATHTPYTSLQDDKHNRKCLMAYMMVSSSWQIYFERALYHRVILHQNDVSWLARRSKRQRDQLRHIWLRIVLESRPCSRSWRSLQDRVRKEVRARDHITAIDALRLLLRMLFAWETWSCRDLDLPPLTLELSIHSISDNEHFHRELLFHDDEHSEPDISELSDESHYWSQGRRTSRAPGIACHSLFEGIHLNGEEEDLFTVRRVNSLLVRRQTRRALGLYRLMEALPNIKTMWLERWKEYPEDMQSASDNMCFFTLSGALRRGATRIVLYEDFNDEVDAFQTELEAKAPPERPQIKHRKPNIIMGQVLAIQDSQLESISVSFQTDFVHFYAGIRKRLSDANRRASLPKLRYLSVTALMLSSTLGGKERVARANSLVRSVANVLVALPNLEIMQLWYGGAREACMFLYKKTKTSIEISWRGTWDIQPYPNVIAQWQRLCDEMGKLLIVQKPEELLQEDQVLSAADAILLLDMPLAVVDPLSLKQMVKEAKYKLFV